MTSILDHLVILPILLPMATGALLLMFDDRLRNARALISLGSAVLLVLLAVLLMSQANAQPSGVLESYAVGNWPAPFGIVLVADRLSAMMVLLTAILGLATLCYSLARWHMVGSSFHSLFQFLLMGINGAFLTGDIFNLFVFFEVMLAASYGLALHGQGAARVRASLHYIAVNLGASFLFLIGAALIYGIAGTLNMADLAGKIVGVQDGSSAVEAVQKDEAAAKSIKELKKFGDNVTALMDLSAGRLDALVVDEVVGRYYTAKKPGEYRVLEENFGTEDYGVGMRKEDTDLHAKIQKALDDMKADGTAATISTKWFGKDIVKK